MGCLRLPLPSIARDIGESLLKATHIQYQGSFAEWPRGTWGHGALQLEHQHVVQFLFDGYRGTLLVG